MFGIGMQEVAIILLVALVFIGPDKLPKVAKTLGKGMRELRRASDDIRSTIMLEDDEPHRTPPPPRRVPTSDQAPAAIAGSLGAGDGEIEDADYSDVTDDDHNPDGTRKSDTGNKESESAAGAPPIGTVGRGGSAAAVTAVVVAQCLAMKRLLSDPKQLAPWYNATGVSLYVLGMMSAAVGLGGWFA